ncbi:MAG: 23S rRNA (pseudouridine(1915)-N(3))-methyltransferase RlmH [Wenzhouxiangellaceae bacterium]
MRLLVVSLGQKMPAWMHTGWQDYARRMPAGLTLSLHELPVSGKQAGCAAQTAALLKHSEQQHRVALDLRGQTWSTEQLASQLQGWQRLGRDVALLVGAADGLQPQVLQAADQCWSLGPLTFPHMLVRVLLAEQLYRAAMIVQGHPYHRSGHPQ